MKAKKNRYDLSLWDLRKLSLYGRAFRSVQMPTDLAPLFAAISRFHPELNPSSGESMMAARITSALHTRPARRDFFIFLISMGLRSKLYFNQDGIKRGGVAHVGKFF
jgi:hypothetical protein